ncbi:MAG: glycosyltransferase [Lachnospiraceae bacterium]|nr:glycosyltransferase [Lachnospiraceae bacterium]
MEILVYPWKSYNYYDVEQSFEKLGHSVTEIDYHIDDYDGDEGFLELLPRIFAEKKYDFVFSVNYFPVISDACEKLGVRYVCWTCDNPLISMYHRSVFNDCNYIFTFDRTNWAEFLAKGCKHIYHLPLAVDTERIDALLAASQDLYLYKNDVSFVGSLYEQNTYDRIKHKLPEFLRGYMEAVIQAARLVSGGNIIEPMLTPEIELMLTDYFDLEKSEGSFSSIGLIFSTTVLGFKVASETRKSALAALAKDFDATLYTNSLHKDLANIRYMGEVDYREEMPKVFKGSRINLNFTIPNIVSGLPLRCFDIMGCGGFLLTNYQPEIPLFFKRGEDLEYFESEEELIDKCAFYLEHENLRARIAQNGLRKIREAHTYDIRVGQMLRILESGADCSDPDVFMRV